MIQKAYMTFTQSRWSYLTCVIFGALLTLGFAPFNQHWLGIVAPIGLFACWQYATPKRALLQGWLFGLGLFGTGASWIYVSIATYGHTNALVAVIATFLFAGLLAAFIAVNGWVNATLSPNPSPKMGEGNKRFITLILIYPTTWVLFEWIRSWLFTGFPWLYIGYTQMHWPLAWYAPIGSVYLVSWLALISGGTLLAIFFPLSLNPSPLRGEGKKKNSPRPSTGEGLGVRVSALLFIVIIWIGGWGLSHVQWSKPENKPIKVGLVQGNISQGMKWNRRYLNHILNVYAGLTERHWAPIVIWPEDALAVFPQWIPHYMNRMKREAIAHDSALLIGMPVYHHTESHYFNAGMVIGDGHGTYLKRHLVPFGEYVPLNWLLGPFFEFIHVPMSNFSAGPDHQELLDLQGFAVALFICYESAYPQEVREHLDHAAWITVITDDSWFGRSLGPVQHEQITAMRALETSRYILLDTDNGVTSIINQHGRIIKQAKSFTATVLTGHVVPMKGNTPWVTIGLWPWLVLWFGLLVLIGLMQRRKRINTHRSGRTDP